MTTTTVQAVVNAAQQLSPTEQFEVIQTLTHVLQQRYLRSDAPFIVAVRRCIGVLQKNKSYTVVFFTMHGCRSTYLTIFFLYDDRSRRFFANTHTRIPVYVTLYGIWCIKQ